MTGHVRERMPVRSRRRLAWLGTLPLLPRHLARTMPWTTLLSGCVAGLAYMAIMAHVADASHSSLSLGTVRISFLPAVAALAFVVRAPFRPLTQATPVPAWVTSAGHILQAAPVLVVMCWALLRLAEPRYLLVPHSHPAALYPGLAQLAGWCAITVAVAACVDRSRYADLGGAVAAPVSLAIIAFAWYLPFVARFLVDPPASARGVTTAWYVIVTAALALTILAMGDRWRRYGRAIRRLRPAMRPPQPR